MANVIFKSDERIIVYDNGSIVVGDYRQGDKGRRIIRNAALPKWVQVAIDSGNVVVVSHIDTATNEDGRIYPIVRGRSVKPTTSKYTQRGDVNVRKINADLCAEQTILTHIQKCVNGEIYNETIVRDTEVIATRPYSDFVDFKNKFARHSDTPMEDSVEVNTQWYLQDGHTAVKVIKQTITPQWQRNATDCNFYYNEDSNTIEFAVKNYTSICIGQKRIETNTEQYNVIKIEQSIKTWHYGWQCPIYTITLDNGKTIEISGDATNPNIIHSTLQSQAQEKDLERESSVVWM